MNALDNLAERRIAEAMQAGLFDDLPGAGKPLPPEDDVLVPEELRVAYRMLRDAGYVPPELEPHRELRSIEQLLDVATDADRRQRAAVRAQFLIRRSTLVRGTRNLALETDYFDRLAARFAR
jgi:hypothetical protein